MMVAMLSVGFVACSSDDDDSDSGSVVGTWSGTTDDDVHLSLNFKKNGTGTWTQRYYDSYYGTEERGSFSFSYEMESKSKGIIITTYYDSYSGDESDYLFFKIEGKKMFLFEGDYDDYLLGVLTKE